MTTPSGPGPREPVFPRTWVLWAMRTALIAAFFVHIVAAAQLTRMNLKARPTRYQSRRDYVTANFASRTMRWTGVITLLFVIFHLLDLTWGTANPDFVEGNPYHTSSRPSSGNHGDRLHPRHAALGLHIFTARGRCSRASAQQPALQHWKRTSQSLRRGHHGRQRQHAVLITTGAVQP